MKQHWLTWLAWLIFASSIVWWLLEKDRKDNWLLLASLSFAVLAVGDGVRRSRVRRGTAEGPPMP